MKRLAIVGGGFMGGALAEGLIDSGWSRDTLVIAEARAERSRILTEKLRVQVTPNTPQAAELAETVLFAVKPQDVPTVLAQVASVFTPQKLAISIAAGVPIAVFEKHLAQSPVIRTMPNTPAAIGHGMTALARGRHATDTHLATALNILGTVSKTIVVDESQMDSVTAVSGTGPAYVYLLAEALIEAAIREGLSSEHAHTLTYQTFIGASNLLRHDPASPTELRKRVTSPQGTTHAAISHLDTHRWSEIFIEAVHAARVRSEELGRSASATDE